MAFQIKRIYDPVAATDGKRILVDRLWPRGISKAKAQLNDWMKDIAPSTELRKWFGHQPEKMAEFAQGYQVELAQDRQKQQAAAQLLQQGKEGMVTLLYAAKDPQINHARVLMEWLNQQ